MTTDIDRLLAAARLRPTAPYSPADIEAAEERISARVAARRSGAAPAPGRPRTVTVPPVCRDRVNPVARNLRALCETVLTRPGALESLAAICGTSLPGPEGARALGAILHLAACEDSARFWWQYAAGAGDTISSYCLYLHHRSHGEDGQADWWLGHTHLTPATIPSETSTELELATALRILASLRRCQDKPLSQTVLALIEYVPAVVGFVDEDLELPLPDTDLAELVVAISTHGASPQPRAAPSPGPLPARTGSAVPPTAPDPATGPQPGKWSRDVEEALRECKDAIRC
ncbi:hypothetical protein ACWGJ2_19750 [Streptomyces sp. NPDC054796]